MSHYTKEQVKQILENAPEGTTPAGVVQALRLEGHTLEGHDGAEKPDSFLKRLQLSFGTKEEQASRVEPKGFMKGGLAEIPRDIADVAGKALPLVGMMAGGAGGTVAGVPTGPGAVASGALGAAAGAAGGEALRQTIGRAIGVQRDQETGKMISIAEGAKGVGIEGAIGATAELGGRAIAPTFNWLIAKPLKNVAGIVGGYSKEMLERIFKRPKETTRAILDAAKDGGAADKMVDAAKLAATKMKNVLQVSYKNNLKKVQEKYGKKEML